VDLLPPRLRDPIRGIVFNSFRGDPSLLDSGIRELEARTGVPFLGVLPYLGDTPMLGAEDSLDFGFQARQPTRSPRPVRVAVLRLPHLANPSDIDPLTHEPDVEVRWISHPSEIAETDLVIIPGSRATVSSGLAASLRESSSCILGLCAGLQMLGTAIDDRVESRLGHVDGLGLLPVQTTFAEPKIVRRSTGTTATGEPVHGYQIRFGRPTPGSSPWLEVDGEPEGAQSADGRIVGTSLHGLLDDDRFREAYLSNVADRQGRVFSASEIAFATHYDRQHERLADWADEAIGVEAMDALVSEAVTPTDAPGW